jgi:Ca-activated chloride channel homolog
MRFGSADYIYGLWAVFAVALFFIWAFRRKMRIMRLFAEKEALGELLREVSFKRQKLKIILILAGLSLCVFALMRPQWGFKWEETVKSGIDIMLAVDVSKSMLATDIKPDRFTRSKLAIRDFVSGLKGDRVGLIAFAGSAYIQCPFTTDYNGFMLALDMLDTDIIPRPGTSISSAIKTALDAYKDLPAGDKVLILITDGEDHDAHTLKLAGQAKDKGITIFCIGIGTSAGELIPVVDTEGKRTFLRDRSQNAVKTRLNEDILKSISLMTGGTYVRSSGADFGLGHVYDERLSMMRKTDRDARMNREYHERYQIPLFTAFLIFITAVFISDKKS